ncbi:MAG: glycosyltransferase family 4 protein, partial [Patescibacteria group bacterium]
MIERNKKNILIVTTSFPCLGKSTSGNFVYELAKRLVSSYNVTVLAPHYSGFKLREKWSGISIYRFRYFFPKWQKVCYGSGILPNIKKNKLLIFVLPFLFIFQFFALIKIIRKEKID